MDKTCQIILIILTLISEYHKWISVDYRKSIKKPPFQSSTKESDEVGLERMPISPFIAVFIETGAKREKIRSTRTGRGGRTEWNGISYRIFIFSPFIPMRMDHPALLYLYFRRKFWYPDSRNLKIGPTLSPGIR